MARKGKKEWDARVDERAGSPQIDVTLEGYGAAVGRGDDRVRVASRTRDPHVFQRRVVLLRTLHEQGHEKLIDSLQSRRVTWREIERAADQGTTKLRALHQSATALSWTKAVAEFLKSYRRKGAADVERQLRTFGERVTAELKRPITVADCTTAQVTWFLSHLERGDGRTGTLSPSTLNRYRGALSTFASWAVQREYLTQHPIAFRRVGAQPESQPRMPVLQPETVRTYINAIFARDPDPLKRRALVLALCILTGADVGSEVLRMREEDVHGGAEQDMVSILYRREKTKTRERLVPLTHPRVLRQLRIVRAHAVQQATAAGQVPMFDELTIWMVWHVHKQARKIIAKPKLSIKDLRHIAVQLWRRAGADLQQCSEWAGHASLEQTKVYAAFGPDAAMDTPVARQLRNLLGGADDGP
jgi:integrase